MPPVAKEVKHHPKSVNNLLVKQLLDRKPHHSIQQFLHTQFSCVSKALAKRIVGKSRVLALPTSRDSLVVTV